jgi:hypothetical protein
MVYRFKCQATGDLLMLEPAGDLVLRSIGRTPSAQGILEPCALPAAAAAKEAAVSQNDAAREVESHGRSGSVSASASGSAASADDSNAQDGPPEARADAVSLRQHAWPFLEMLRRAQQAGQPVVWGV